MWTTVGFADTLANFIKTHPPIDLIFAHNDRLALEIYNICEALKLPKKIKIIGVDGLEGKDEGLDLVSKNTINATILYPTGGEEAIQTAVKILKNRHLTRKISYLRQLLIPKMSIF